MQLREYQQKAINITKQSMQKGNKKICLTLATGAGKSIIARKIVESAISKGSSVIYLTYRTVLIDQMRETFKGLDVEYGTLQKHCKTETKKYDLVIVDEVHWAHGSKLYNNINCKYLVGLSATPTDADGNALEFDDIIDVVQLKDLIDLGYASPVRVLSTSKVDTSKLKGAKDFTQKSSYEMMEKSEILKDIVQVYQDHAIGKTIIYSVNIEHAEKLKTEFLEADIHCDTVHSKKDTKQLIQDFRDGAINVLINVDILTTGLDLPDIYTLILASPTKSLIKATQIYGRATRLDPNNPDKEALIIDCCEVIKNTQHPYQRFDFTKKKTDKKQKTCKKCENTMIVIDKRIKPIDKFMFTQITKYKCSVCTNFEEVEDIKTVNYTFCDGCGDVLEAGNIEYKQTDNKIEFVSRCKCGFEKTEREILLTDKELREVAYEETINGEDTWDKVEVILKDVAKELKYHWKWAAHRLVALKASGLTPEEVLKTMEENKAKGYKLASISYIGVKK